MIKRPVVLTSAALRDVAEILEYVRAANPGAAVKLSSGFYERMASLSTFPLRGREIRDHRLGRYRVVSVGSYLVFYIVTDTKVQIRRVVHGARTHEPLLEPLGDLIVHEETGRY